MNFIHRMRQNVQQRRCLMARLALVLIINIVCAAIVDALGALECISSVLQFREDTNKRKRLAEERGAFVFQPALGRLQISW